jgi:predicted DNA-binding transcriptional regulator AlpA
MNLIGTADIAAMLGLGREHVTSRVTKRADFPVPVLVLSRKTVRWESADVEKWIERQRAMAARRPR